MRMLHRRGRPSCTHHNMESVLQIYTYVYKLFFPEKNTHFVHVALHGNDGITVIWDGHWVWVPLSAELDWSVLIKLTMAASMALCLVVAPLCIFLYIYIDIYIYIYIYPENDGYSTHVALNGSAAKHT